MGKTRDAATVVLSSDDDEGAGARSTSRSYSKPKSRRLVTRSANPREPKKRRIPNPRQSSCVDAVKFPCEDFEDFFYGSKVSAGETKAEAVRMVSDRSTAQDLWVDKYRPCSLEELAVHKKKVEEVKSWVEERVRAPQESWRNYVLIISGQAGVGKSTTIQSIASLYGVEVCEWGTPVPTIWQEHLHNSSTGIQYTSKLDEFINFIENVRKFGLISSSSLGGSKASTFLLIDDLPVTNGRHAFERLRNSLLLLVRSTCIPTAIIVTECGNLDSVDHNARFMEELQSSLVDAGACKVAFNPITNNSIKKTLTRICRLEQRDITTEQIDLLAKSCGGDIRHAITSLQLFCLKQAAPHNSTPNTLTPSYPDAKTDDVDALTRGFSSLFGRDETLSLFHALGKFLHNKRETELYMSSDRDDFLVREKLNRLPIKMDSPEKILCQAHGQARPVADFLHENVLDFMSDDAMDNAWDVASYLSDADLLLSSFRGISAGYNEVENILQSTGASVAVRGVLFGNSHPSPSRWHAIRRPRLWQVEQSMLNNHKEMLRLRSAGEGESISYNAADTPAEFSVVLKWLQSRASCVEAEPAGDQRGGQSSENMSLDDEDISEDEIEDC